MSVPLGIVCTPEEYARSIEQPETIHCLRRPDNNGLMVIIFTSITSISAISYVFLLILWKLYRRRESLLRIFHLPIDVMMFSLFLAEALQAIGGIVNISWVQYGKVESGSFCRAQGIIQTFGETGVAFSTLGIAIHTFLGVRVGLNIQSIKYTCVTVLSFWLLIAILLIIGIKTNHNFIAPSPFWCWIRPLVWKIFNEYVWIWISLLVSLCLYPVLMYWMRENPDNTIRRQAFIMALYPLVYAISVLPMSAARWIGFVQESKYGMNRVPAAATLAVGSIFALSGFFNVVLLLTTRPEAELFGGMVSDRHQRGLPPTGAPEPELPDTEFPSPAVPLQPIRSPANPQLSKDSRDQGFLP